MATEVWFSIVPHLDILSLMSLEQTCRTLRNVCQDESIWKPLYAFFEHYDHFRMLKRETLPRQRRRLVKLFHVLRYLTRPRPQDMYSGEENVSVPFRTSRLFASVPHSWRVLYWCVLLEKPRHFWHIVGSPTYHQDASRPLYGEIYITFQLTARKRKRTHPNVVPYDARVVCHVGWDTSGIYLRELPMDTASDRRAVLWDRAMVHRTDWASVTRVRA